MKAPVLIDARKIVFQDKPKPRIESGEVLVKVEYCGICGSDVHAYQNGILYPVGTVMGHEFSGMIAEVGEDVELVRPGDRVAVKPSASCLNCHWCKNGRYSLCPKRRERVIGISPGNDGAFGEYVKIRYPNQMLFKLPPNVTSDQAALAEPLSISFHSVRLSRLNPGDDVLIIGAGMIGLGVLQLLKLEGAGKIIVLEVSEKKSLLARKLGADFVLNPKSERAGLTDHILSLTDEIGPNIVFECAGVPFAFQTSIDYVRSGGQVLVIGLQEKEVPFDAFKLLHKEVELKGVYGSYDEFKDVIKFFEQGKINTEVLISDIISAGDLVERGFERLLTSNDDVKILVRVEESGPGGQMSK